MATSEIEASVPSQENSQVWEFYMFLSSIRAAMTSIPVTPCYPPKIILIINCKKAVLIIMDLKAIDNQKALEYLQCLLNIYFNQVSIRS